MQHVKHWLPQQQQYCHFSKVAFALTRRHAGEALEERVVDDGGSTIRHEMPRWQGSLLLYSPGGMLVKHLRNESSTMAAAPSDRTWLVLRTSLKTEGFGPALHR